MAAHSTTVTADPHVPGPGRIRPMPSNVAMAVAHNGARELFIRSAGVLAGCGADGLPAGVASNYRSPSESSGALS